MKLPHIKMALAAVWVFSALLVLLGSAHVTSLTDRIALALFGALPPLTMWFWWNEPTLTMSQSIHKVRDEGRAARARRAGD